MDLAYRTALLICSFYARYQLNFDISLVMNVLAALLLSKEFEHTALSDCFDQSSIVGAFLLACSENLNALGQLFAATNLPLPVGKTGTDMWDFDRRICMCSLCAAQCSPVPKNTDWW